MIMELFNPRALPVSAALMRAERQVAAGVRDLLLARSLRPRVRCVPVLAADFAVSVSLRAAEASLGLRVGDGCFGGEQKGFVAVHFASSSSAPELLVNRVAWRVQLSLAVPVAPRPGVLIPALVVRTPLPFSASSEPLSAS